MHGPLGTDARLQAITTLDLPPAELQRGPVRRRRRPRQRPRSARAEAGPFVIRRYLVAAGFGRSAAQRPAHAALVAFGYIGGISVWSCTANLIALYGAARRTDPNHYCPVKRTDFTDSPSKSSASTWSPLIRSQSRACTRWQSRPWTTAFAMGTGQDESAQELERPPMTGPRYETAHLFASYRGRLVLPSGVRKTTACAP